MEKIQVIGFNHNSISLDELGKMHISPEEAKEKLSALKSEMDFLEIAYLSTCNRIEFYIVAEHQLDKVRLEKVFRQLYSKKNIDAKLIAQQAKIWQGINAVNHIIEVASSIDSMVVGEREIITQIKSAFDFAKKNKLSGDLLRLVEKQTIQTAKKVYTTTFISNKSVSVVGLAFKELLKFNVNENTKVLVLGAGATNKTMCKLLKENGVLNFTVFNRSKERGEILSESLDSEFIPFSRLGSFNQEWDILISCTASDSSIIDNKIYSQLIKNNPGSKTIVDLSIPNDIDPSVIAKFNPNYISVQHLKELSGENINARKKELLKVSQIIFEGVESFKDLFERRSIELKLKFIPEQLKSIRETATKEVFQKELESLDKRSKDVLDKVLNYMEKKYVGVPMKMAKELLTEREEN